jgi:two-component system LytT family response regulator
MLQAVIIDDQRINADMLQQLVQQFCTGVAIAGVCTTIEEGYMLIRKTQPDIVFLDVELNDDDTGFDLLEMFKPVFFKIIFITAHSHYAINAFRENAVDYLLKPVNIRQLQIAVAKAEQAIELERRAGSPAVAVAETRISLPTQEGYIFVHPDEVLFCEGSGSYTHFHMSDGRKITISMHLKECEAILPPAVFSRIHNSYIVNISYITKYIRGRIGTVVLNDSIQLEVSASRKDAFLNKVRKI